MSIVRALVGLEQPSDLPRLAAALGAEPLWQELDPLAWLGGRTAALVASAVLVGRDGELPWFGLESAVPDEAAAAVAARLAAAGRAAVVLALDGRTRRLALAAAWGARPVLALDAAAPDGVALACLARLAAPREGGRAARAAAAADALAGDGVGTHFFREFRATLDRMAAGIAGASARGRRARGMPGERARLGAAEHRELALLQLTRVLFLYFVQSKGWLAGDEGFLARQVDRGLARGRRLHRDLFRPLFFGTLNRRAEERGRGARAFGAVPFLNGGLFEPHPLERRWRGDVPNDLWRDAFDRLFERFHFTVDERGAGARIAPDMLGRVFEGLMAPDHRRGTGAFYTPSCLVARVLDAAFAAHAGPRLGLDDAAAAARLAAHDPRAVAALDGLTLLDPAVGSGAFLLGALERLAALRGGGRPTAALKRAILARSLFGVDLDATAVRLTELRLWLSVVADDDAVAAAAVRPLPNLDCLVRQGDSLLDGLRDLPDLPSPDPAAAFALGDLRRRIVEATGAPKRALTRELRRRETATLDALLGRAERAADAAIAACLADAHAPTLLEPRRGLDRDLRARLAEARGRRRRVREVRRRLARTGEVPWFAYGVHFADVAARGGFDLVVGNPPWVRAEELAPALRARLAERYAWWRSGPAGAGDRDDTGRGGGARGFAHRPDLSLAFLERATRLAAPGGVVAFLLPAKLATTGYAARARGALAAATTLHAVADLTDDPGARFDATVYPLALVASVRRAPYGHRIRTALDPRPSPGVTQAALAARPGAPWVLVPDEVAAALAALRAAHPVLGARLRCRLGVKTGANDVFLDPPHDVEPEVVRRAVRGRDVHAFRCRPGPRLLWPCDAAGAPLPTLPPRAARHLEAVRARLERRTDFDGGPPWALFRTAGVDAAYRLVWPDLGRALQAAALTGAEAAAWIPLNTCYVAPVASAGEAHALAAWLNSGCVRLVARLGAVPAAAGYRRFTAATISALPLPAAVPRDADLAALGRAGARGRPVQDDLDALALQLLDLPTRARRTLESLVRGDAGDADDRR